MGVDLNGQAALLWARLQAAQGAPVSVAALADTLWPDPARRPDSHPSRLIAAMIFKLRLAGCPVLTVRGRGQDRGRGYAAGSAVSHGTQPPVDSGDGETLEITILQSCERSAPAPAGRATMPPPPPLCGQRTYIFGAGPKHRRARVAPPTQSETDAAVASYLARGGTVTECPPAHALDRDPFGLKIMTGGR